MQPIAEKPNLNLSLIVELIEITFETIHNRDKII